MNDGIWPETPAPDPWLNRVMRQKVGLLLPERRIGLSAHDYMLAVAGREVWITRSTRSDDADTVPSRWINRLTNLLDGLPDQRGPVALADMKARGDDWLAKAAIVSAPNQRVDAAKRPSPRPPVDARPKRLSVTRIKTLIRDPYAIYAEFVLRLRQLDPLTPSADAPMRGIILHAVMEQFSRAGIAPDAPDARDRLMQIAAHVLTNECPWPTVRKLWLARLDRVADWFLATEIGRQALATPTLFEEKGAVALDGLDFTLSAKADRFDVGPDGAVTIYDYKTGTVPSPKEQKFFDKQLLLEAAMVEAGSFTELGKARVEAAKYIGLGPKPAEAAAPLDETTPSAVWVEFHKLIRTWTDPARGYSARIWMQQNKDVGHYDHLSRFGEWDQTTEITPEDLT
jgi:ATP-dependent helicase/nuclease subunit B